MALPSPQLIQSLRELQTHGDDWRHDLDVLVTEALLELVTKPSVTIRKREKDGSWKFDIIAHELRELGWSVRQNQTGLEIFSPE